MTNNTIFDDVFRTMAVRMVEYDFAIALEHRKKVDGRYCVEFPRSCVLYLRNGKRTPDFLEVELILPDSQMCVYRVPTVKVENYTKDSIFEKKLLMLLPFYIMRYEKVADIIEKDSEKLQRLLSEYEDIRNKLGKEISISGRAELYTDLNRLIMFSGIKKKFGKELARLWVEKFCSWNLRGFARKEWRLEKRKEKRKEKQRVKRD